MRLSFLPLIFQSIKAHSPSLSLFLLVVFVARVKIYMFALMLVKLEACVGTRLRGVVDGDTKNGIDETRELNI